MEQSFIRIYTSFSKLGKKTEINGEYYTEYF